MSKKSCQDIKPDKRHWTQAAVPYCPPEHIKEEYQSGKQIGNHHAGQNYMGDGIPYSGRAEQENCHRTNNIGWLESPPVEERNQ